METPDPIPNSAVKRVSADNIDFARNREDRSGLGNHEAVFLLAAVAIVGTYVFGYNTYIPTKGGTMNGKTTPQVTKYNI